MPSLKSWILQSSAVSTFAAVCGLVVYTKHCHFVPIAPLSSSLSSKDDELLLPFYRKFNPHDNPTVHDVCVRKIPLFKVRRELVEDAERGGGKLVERFAGGCWGNFGHLIQRKVLETKHRSNPSLPSTQLWSRPSLLESSYPVGTSVLNHFEVLAKTSNTILFRAGDSPFADSAKGPREMDGFLELSARADLEKGFAEFTFKTVFFQGNKKMEVKPMPAVMEWAHRWYTKLLVETGVKNCMN